MFNWSKDGEWYACITGLVCCVLTGLDVTVVAFVTHFFPVLLFCFCYSSPVLQCSLAKDDQVTYYLQVSLSTEKSNPSASLLTQRE